MSEAMALERMAQILAELEEENYHTSTRVPYLAKKTSSGKKKSGKQAGDLDVVGIGVAKADINRKLLVVECKGYGGPEDYQNWLAPRNLESLIELVQGPSENIKEILDTRWDNEFQKRQYKPDEIWIVFPGYFFPRSDPSKRSTSKLFDKNMKNIASDLYNEEKKQITENKRDYRIRGEIRLLNAAEENLGQIFNVKVKLFPIHILLQRIFILIKGDMTRRRKRYPDTAMEMIRWIVRTVNHDWLDLKNLEKEIK